MKDPFKLEKSVLSVVKITDDRDTEYWLNKAPDERFAAIEINRTIIYGYDRNDPPRLQRFLEVVKQPWS